MAGDQEDENVRIMPMSEGTGPSRSRISPSSVFVRELYVGSGPGENEDKQNHVSELTGTPKLDEQGKQHASDTRLLLPGPSLVDTLTARQSRADGRGLQAEDFLWRMEPGRATRVGRPSTGSMRSPSPYSGRRCVRSDDPMPDKASASTVFVGGGGGDTR